MKKLYAKLVLGFNDHGKDDIINAPVKLRTIYPDGASCKWSYKKFICKLKT